MASAVISTLQMKQQRLAVASALPRAWWREDARAKTHTSVHAIPQSTVFSQHRASLSNRILPFPKNDVATFLKQGVLISEDLEDVLVATSAFLVV